MEREYNLVELFSGIGSQAKALENIDMVIGQAYTCEWDIHALTAYDSIHKSPDIPSEYFDLNKEVLLEKLKDYTLSSTGKVAMSYDILRTYSVDALRRIYVAIKRSKNYVDITKLTGDKIPDGIDILTYSFPCQDLSNVGAFHGYNKGIDKDSGSRSSLLWQVGRILEEMNAANKGLPRFLLMENVPTLLSPRHRDNFHTWIDDLKKLGYSSMYYELNAINFGLPQNRPRLLMISVLVGQNDDLKKRVRSYFYSKTKNDIISDYLASPYYKKIAIGDLLRLDYSNEKLFQEACDCTPNDTVSRRAIWDENPKLVLEGNIVNPENDMIRTITTKQDRNPNSGNVFFDSKIPGRSHFRYLTPRECFLFMGFSDEDYENVINYNPEVRKGTRLLSRDKLIKMAGNSIPVKLLEGIFLQVKQIDESVFGNG